MFSQLLHHFVDGAVIGMICAISPWDGSVIGFNVMLHELSAVSGVGVPIFTVWPYFSAYFPTDRIMDGDRQLYKHVPNSIVEKLFLLGCSCGRHSL